MKSRRLHAFQTSTLLCTVILLLSGCGGVRSMLEMMPAPATLVGNHDAVVTHDSSLGKQEAALLDMLYATSRAKASQQDKEQYYTGERGYLVRVGAGRINFGDSNITWDEARKISLLKNRPGTFPLSVRDIQEYGVVPDSVSQFTPYRELESIHEEDAVRFVEAIEQRLAKSTSKEIYIYVHGYKVEFENPLLVASELWHFLGYEGAFIAYSWPSTPAKLAYFKDTETARVSAWGLRQLLGYLARETSAEKINIIGYSAGTRVVVNALHELALIHQNSPEEALDSIKLGRVVLVGSDVDTGTFASYLLDGLLRVQDQLNLYVSPSDKALAISEKVLNHRRIGEVLPGTLDERMREFVLASNQMHFIDVEDAENFDSGNGHAYFRKSPWVSADVLMTIRHGYPPAERGLVRIEESPIWRFPDDYISRIEKMLMLENTVEPPSENISALPSPSTEE